MILDLAVANKINLDWNYATGTIFYFNCSTYYKNTTTKNKRICKITLSIYSKRKG